MKTALLTLLSIICLAITSNSQTSWAAKTTIDEDTGNNPYTIASGQIDTDTNLDILIGTDVDHIIVWYKGNGDGTFVKQTPVTNTLINIGGIKLVDLNNDGDKDILAVGFGDYAFTANYGVGSKIVWFENDGSGNFGAEQLIYDGYIGMSGLFVGNIDADSTPDIGATSYAGSQVFWMSNDGSGVFSAPNTIDTTLSFPGSINMKDIDSDGDLDALVATGAAAGADTVEIFRNDLVPGGAVAWAKDATSVSTGKNYIFNATFEDLDGDANLDILITETNTTPGGGNFYWAEEDGFGGYTETTFVTAIGNPSVAQVKDLDNDGLDDIVLSSGALADVTDLVWYKNNGAGVFAAEAVINDTQSQVFVFTVADFDGDLDLDIASNAFGADNLNYIENLLETLDITEFENQTIKIFPNPAKDILNFEGFNSASIEISIFDILGKSVLNRSLNTNETLDVSQLVNGIYTITINGTFASKFIKE
jgi:hypothetical protein